MSDRRKTRLNLRRAILTGMFNKYQAVFRSRWRALFWAGGVLLTAYCTVPAADNAKQSKPAPEQHHHVNPWALDKSN